MHKLHTLLPDKPVQHIIFKGMKYDTILYLLHCCSSVYEVFTYTVVPPISAHITLVDFCQFCNFSHAFENTLFSSKITIYTSITESAKYNN